MQNDPRQTHRLAIHAFAAAPLVAGAVAVVDRRGESTLTWIKGRSAAVD